MISSWPDVVALLGAVGLTAGAGVTVLKTIKSAGEPVSIENIRSMKSNNERLGLLEQSIRNMQEHNKRLEAGLVEQRRRHDKVVDDIYSAINDVRKMFIETLKNNKNHP